MNVVVLGMHRSGTSAIAGALRFLGLHLPDEHYLLPAQPDNPRGFFENRLLLDLNDRILEAFGGHWSAPALSPGWQEDPSLDELRAEAERTFQETMPPRPWVWKDPRTCLTLPFWLPALGDKPPTIVYIGRDPRGVARSLEERNGIQPATSAALWERYTRDSLGNMRGLRVVTVRFEDLLEDPVGVVRRVGNDLEALGVPVTDPNDHLVREFLTPPADGGGSGEGGRTELSGEQEALCEVVASLQSRYEGFPNVDLPPATPWTDTLLEERRRHLEEDRRQVAEQQRLATQRDAAKQARQTLAQERRRLAQERRRLAQEHQRFRGQLRRERRELMDLRRRHAALRTRYEEQIRARPMWIRTSSEAYRRYKARTKQYVGSRYKGRRSRRR